MSVSGVERHRYAGKNHLEAGSFVHKGENKFECQQCDKTFKYKSLLQTHSGVRNYECKECGETFIYKSHLTTHPDTVVLKNINVKNVGKNISL